MQNRNICDDKLHSVCLALGQNQNFWQHYSYAHEQLAHGLHALCIVGTVGRHGYSGQQKALFVMIVDVSLDLKHTEAIFHQIQLIRCAYESLRCIHVYLKIWRFLYWWWLITPCTCKPGNMFNRAKVFYINHSSMLLVNSCTMFGEWIMLCTPN
jgi:hypothetical protein